MQNAAARISTGTKRKDHLTAVLAHLQWLTVRFRIDLKIFKTFKLLMSKNRLLYELYELLYHISVYSSWLLISALAGRNKAASVLDADDLGRSITWSTLELRSLLQPIMYLHVYDVSLVTHREMFDMVYLRRWIVGKVCQGHPIFRDESHWVAFSPATGWREKRTKEDRIEEVTCSCSTERWRCGLLNLCGGKMWERL